MQRFGGIHMAKADSSDLDGFEKTSPYWVKVKQLPLPLLRKLRITMKNQKGDPS